jgi:4-nitrophenyl phosphatase
LDSQAKILKKIECLLIDMDGTIYIGENLLEGSTRLIETLLQLGKDFLFLTNNSSISRYTAAEKLSRLGLNITPEKILTSGEATAIYLQIKHPGARVFVVGNSVLQEEFSSRGFTLTDKNPEYTILGFDTSLTYDKLWKLSEFVYSGIPYIATNADRTCLYEHGFMPEIAPMIAYIESATGIVPEVIIGKPNPVIADIASKKCGHPVSSMAIIGDVLDTDIALGHHAGIPAFLLLTGETQEHQISDSKYRPNRVFTNLDALTDYFIKHLSSTTNKES